MREADDEVARPLVDVPVPLLPVHNEGVFTWVAARIVAGVNAVNIRND